LKANFCSDNVAPIAAEILSAIVEANADDAVSYGEDAITLRLRNVASEIFEKEVAIFPVVSGTAANGLALSQIAAPFSGIYCHEFAHIVTDECGAPELFTAGAKLLPLRSPDGILKPSQVSDAVALAQDMGVHHVPPAAISITQATEWGTVYSLDQVNDLAELARRHGLRIHMDGARFANALVHLGCTPAQATWKSGVDVLCLGATKNGAMGAEAVVFFDPVLARDFEFRRKRAGQLLSKMRFVSAQLLAYLTHDLWLSLATHSNAMATLMAEGLAAIAGARLLHKVQANEVFVALPDSTVAHLQTQGFGFYRWPVSAVAPLTAIRLMTSFDTTVQEVRDFLQSAGEANHVQRV
jgi:threonine aldolase